MYKVETIDRVVGRLQVVKMNTTSLANKELLSECIEELHSMQASTIQEEEAKEKPHFQVMDRVKFRSDIGGLIPTDQNARFIINTVDEKNGRVWVVDAFEKVRPRWLALSLIELAND